LELQSNNQASSKEKLKGKGNELIGQWIHATYNDLKDRICALPTYLLTRNKGHQRTQSISRNFLMALLLHNHYLPHLFLYFYTYIFYLNEMK